jgi:hypothetical protein
MRLNVYGHLECLDGSLILLQVHEAEALIVPGME